MSRPGDEAPPRGALLRALFSTRMLVALATGFSSGLPLLLTRGTLQAWMVDAHVDLKQIGLFALVGLPYSLKFLWSPLFDRFVPPLLGRRRGWMLATQLAVAASLAALALGDPAGSPLVVAAIAVVVAFSSASQDIVLDAYRRESLPDRELGLGTSIFINGYRLAMIVSGAMALWLADRLSWPQVYLAMAGFMLVGVATTLLCREPEVDAPPPRTLRAAVVEPFVEFLQRPRAGTVLLFLFLYKLGDQLATSINTPFYLELGFTKSEVAAVAKVFGMLAMIGGGLVGGAVIFRIGIQRSLWIFGVVQALGILAFVGLAEAGHVQGFLALAVFAETFTSGMGSAAYAAFIGSLTDRRFTATQYALLSSIMALGNNLAGATTGFLVRAGDPEKLPWLLQGWLPALVGEGLGWERFFLLCTAACLPGLLMLPRVAPWRQPPRPDSSSAQRA